MDVQDPEIPYVSNTTAEFVASKDQVKDLLGKQVYSSVRWEQSIHKMIESGSGYFYRDRSWKNSVRLYEKD